MSLKCVVRVRNDRDEKEFGSIVPPPEGASMQQPSAASLALATVHHLRHACDPARRAVAGHSCWVQIQCFPTEVPRVFNSRPSLADASGRAAGLARNQSVWPAEVADRVECCISRAGRQQQATRAGMRGQCTASSGAPHAMRPAIWGTSERTGATSRISMHFYFSWLFQLNILCTVINGVPSAAVSRST